ncbi:HAD family hydrolase [Kitasatospora camelliae]|uniref:HAD family hydrolase n=1 Tax=Kitasatospora camelliae TaxID=3156397 RepID=A0AAU8K388_9ACTN
MPEPIAAVSFDADDTLWDFASGWRPAMEHSARLLGDHHTPEELEEIRNETAAAMPGAGLGAIRRAAFAESLRRIGEPHPDRAERIYREFLRVRAERTELFPETRSVLERLAAARIPLAVTTNGTADLAWFGLHEVFPVVVRGGDCGVSKPDPGIYLVTAGRLGLPPGRVLHVGDHPVEDLAAARAAGLQALLLDRAGAPAESAIGSLEAVADLLGA